MTPPRCVIGRARLEQIGLLPAIELTAAQLLSGHAPATVLDEVTDTQTLTDAVRHGRLWVALADDVPVGFALVEVLASDLPHLDEVNVAPAHGRRGLGTALVRALRMGEGQRFANADADDIQSRALESALLRKAGFRGNSTRPPSAGANRRHAR